jgi:hypothetical protein
VDDHDFERKCRPVPETNHVRARLTEAKSIP